MCEIVRKAGIVALFRACGFSHLFAHLLSEEGHGCVDVIIVGGGPTVWRDDWPTFIYRPVHCERGNMSKRGCRQQDKNNA